MSFRGRGGGRGGFTPRGGGRGGFGGGGGGGYGDRNAVPDQVFEMGSFMHSCETEMVCESTNAKIPYFNAPIYLENKTPVGKVDEILGPMNQVYFTIKPEQGIVSTTFKAGDKFYIGGDKLLPIERFLPQPKAVGVKKPKSAGGRGGARGGGRGAPRGRGSFGGGRGAPRGRGGFSAGRGAPRGDALKQELIERES